ncbi:DUF2249 domain-containing protein [Tuberibacillus calidus]|jgi:hypothetical protein|uniref:DUF2249 domain-containing protein n=1 Tax=Tuberibacillus calidus TaxID=340097 RepID=UPI0003F7BBE3|nr:DUF2249 domain-containing protein [Tuberibacillus calidus]
MAERKVVELDVRPTLEAGGEPFEEIMGAVKSLGPSDVFVLHATFNPIPLLRVMERKGYVNEPEQVEKGHWVIRFWKENES